MSDRRRRRVLGWGAAALAGFYGLGAAVMVPWVQDDLEERVETVLADAGVPGVEADFSGQDGTLRCDRPIGSAVAVEDLAEDVWGVRVASVDGCTLARPTPTPPSTAAAPTTTTEPPRSELLVAAAVADDGAAVVLRGTVDTEAQRSALVAAAEAAFGADAVTDRLEVAGVEGAGGDATVAAVGDLAASLAGRVVEGEAGYNGVALYLNGTVLDAESDTAIRDAATGLGVAPDDVDLVARPASGLVATAGVAAGSTQVTLSGSVETDAQRTVLVDAATEAYGAGNVVDRLEVLGVAPTADEDAERLAELLRLLTPNLSEGEASFDGTTLRLSGRYVSDDARAIVEQAAAELGLDPAAVSLSPRDAASADQAAELEAALNAAVGATPIPFDQSQSTLRPEADAILDQVAALARTYAGVSISVDGHTDADGSDAANLALSQARADTVLAALVERGVPADQLVARGFGETEPVAPNDTPANKALNRRVVFSVVTQ